MPETKTQTVAADKPAVEVVVRDESTALAPFKEKVPPRTFLEKSAADLEHMVAHYPEPARTETIWTQGFCREACQGNLELLRAIAEKLGYSYSRAYFNNVLQGYYFRLRKPREGQKGTSRIEGNPAAWCEIVAALRKHDREMTTQGKLGFIETPTYRFVRSFILEHWAPGAVCKFGGITGPTGAQKSAIFKYLRLLNNHGKMVHFEAPARPSIVAFQRKLAAQYHAKIGNNASAREESIRENVTAEKCIIIDNVQRLYHPHAGADQPVFNYLLELQDDTGATFILSFTDDFFRDDLTAGRAKGYFEQFLGRMGGLSDILRLPAHTPEPDLRAIARAYHLHDGTGALEYLERWSRIDGRIRIVFARLNRAQKFAQLDDRDRITLADLEGADTYQPPSVADDEGGAV